MSDTQKWQLLALTVVLGFLLWLLAPVLTPFAISALLAYLGDPMVDRLENWKLSRSLAVAVVFVLMSLALVGVALLLVPMLERQISYLVEQFPRYRDWFQNTALPWIESRTGIDIVDLDPASLFDMLKDSWTQAGGVAATVLGGLSKSGLAVLGWVANVALIPVVTFYLLRDWDVLVERVRMLLPRPIEPTVSRLARESDHVLGGFLRGQLSVMLALGTIYALGLWMVGIDLALLIGLIAGLVSFIPYLGAIVGVGAALIAALVQHGDWLHVVLVLAVFGVGQTIESFLLTPLLVGDRIGMHPVAVIFAIMAGGQLFGFFGVLLALPVAAVTMVVLRYAYERYTTSRLYGAAVGAVAAVPDDASDAALSTAAATGEAPPVAPAPAHGASDERPHAPISPLPDPHGRTAGK
ncbi:putative PurR-regulated permease PerM [Chiayiivirga flava]|uniref:Putative PurR-regulated permease PerM n=2 Tax=Chiayiivirga flava TaxID=659595 RepID=A0A7W8G1I1_9GAMM|nr:AI-2E family transporter [Chiayiivirga flava]MBB5209454.1 putative PurR-regulated permease PerM [Chiayiivirga flava]